MLKSVALNLDEIYVPTKHRKTLDAEKVESIAESIIENGQQTPIQVRQGKDRYVLITGIHRLEALKELGEEKIEAYIVSAQKF